MNFFRKKRLFVFLIGIIILVVMIGFSINDRDHLTTPEQFVNDTIGWAQSAIHAPVDFVTTFFEDIDEIKKTYEENKILKEKLAENKNLIYEVQEIKKENAELRETLDKTESIRDYEPIQATVIARSPERWIEQIKLNKGKQAGIQPNMAVITADGMIGKVQTASEFTSTVQLLTGFDQLNRISATIAREDAPDIFGLIEGYDRKTDTLMFKMIEHSGEKLEKGELVVSSGMGGVFPAGLTIGEVKDVVPDQYGLTNTALVEPAANMYDVNNVIVVSRTMVGKREENEEGAE
ncbi:Cell shape-determining protein MreC [Lentibacillus sp. JNUCC-1]|uniref:rod shape-determining protein MreC n=1 Tax=Lentibacillus sp. JNUCC-1 TaxID=2654513 RepID=UPI0012E8A964|nr:rod shape-determining protein MreC [Lentibacillus sp. JNUCC-1]MUV39498.1 Cell shape-determining protein MreC [Lentibacillus sp. JNUCC-1]